MSASGSRPKADAADGEVLTAHPVEDLPVTPHLTDRPRRLRCTVAVAVGEDSKVGLRINNEPGAMLAVFGSHGDEDNGKPPPAFAGQAITDLVNVALGSHKLTPGDLDPFSTDKINSMIAAVGAFQPADELEGMIAVQAAALHFVTMESLARGMRTERNEFRQAHLGQANKCARTFAALVETLNRHRGKTTTQRVIVENVNVAPGAQAVVGAVLQQRGAGVGVGSQETGAVQSHGRTNENQSGGAEKGERITALPSPQSIGQPMSAAGDERKEALPHARRRGRDRSAEGQSKQGDARALHRAGNGRAKDDPRAAAKRGRSALSQEQGPH